MVIGIIAVLIAILLPVLARARAAANRVVCLSNIRQLGMGILLYCNDNDGWFPTCGYWQDGTAYVQYPDDWLYWQANRNLDDSPIAKYLNVHGEQLKSLLRCPADTFEGRKARVGISPGQGPYFYSYNMNHGLAANVKPPFSARTRISMWRVPSRKPMLTEVLESACNSSAWGYATPLTWRHGSGVSRGTGLLPAGTQIGTNVSTVFIDGHAEGSDWDSLCQLFSVRPDMD